MTFICMHLLEHAVDTHIRFVSYSAKTRSFTGDKSKLVSVEGVKVPLAPDLIAGFALIIDIYICLVCRKIWVSVYLSAYHRNHK